MSAPHLRPSGAAKSFGATHALSDVDVVGGETRALWSHSFLRRVHEPSAPPSLCKRRPSRGRFLLDLARTDVDRELPRTVARSRRQSAPFALHSERPAKIQLPEPVEPVGIDKARADATLL